MKTDFNDKNHWNNFHITLSTLRKYNSTCKIEGGVYFAR